ncbi:glycerophosphoryl diester phosphodiesterase [Endozoicomonas lisbonensis]|uniref:Glycerophosphoryl diester phosphodiesterase n=1 Tax=Endozoicomonas lisbonensis TaxID=3120522 RepID=A0ABV2SF77_9GAMM
MNLLMSEMIGHRGVASLAPENTLAGIRTAAELGLEWVELDVTLLGDGAAVMFHDPRLNRTTNGRGHLKKQTLISLKSLDAGSWHSEQWRGEKVPELDEALSLIKALGLGLNLELKPNRCDLHRLVDQVITALEQADFPVEKLLVSSFNHKALVLFRGRCEHQIGCLFETLPRNWCHKAQMVGAVSIHVNAEKLTEAGAKAVKAGGYQLYCYTVNDTQLLSRLKSWQVDGVFSDCPQDLK